MSVFVGVQSLNSIHVALIRLQKVGGGHGNWSPISTWSHGQDALLEAFVILPRWTETKVSLFEYCLGTGGFKSVGLNPFNGILPTVYHVNGPANV